ncbi:uncharacterized protein LOC110043504 isoform X2 [Orbicella faveolata]|uniref:uncharacterized protein LOC110043504 isoform X2 n=1 Tax=Orbicella faveolata TaxID=48498 RepID=UPI0009E618C5|nr:uncharacterized protein LOC110043504 isoform X2 [Orbicella faveolata]
MRGGCHRFLTSLAFQIRRKKAFSWRFYCQNVLSGPEGSDTGFNPTKRALDRAERQFELLGAEATFQGSALKLEDAPKLRLPEGHTRLVNFFNIGSKMYLVDLPGYGYVAGLGSKRGTEHFVNVAESYLKERAGKELRSVCLLIDGKVGVKKNDLIAFEMMGEFGGPFQVVLTKMDKLPIVRHQMMIEEVYKIKEEFGLNNCFPHIFPVR